MKPQDLWSVFNLREPPYFRESLSPGDDAGYPVECFVGREIEADELVRTILFHGRSTQQTIRGPVGVGKSTLVQHVKTILAPYGLYSSPGAVALGQAGSACEACLRILSYVYETLLVAGQEQDKLAVLEKNEAMQDTRQLIQVFREITGFSGGVSIPVLGGGLNAGRSISLHTPSTALPSILIAGLLKGMFKAAREHLNARGIIVHVNNLQDISAVDAAKAGVILRDLRDTALFAEGYHWLIVGTRTVLREAVGSYATLHSVFSTTLRLKPLKPDELTHLLNRRYTALAADPTRPVRPPITHQAVQALYALFQGDLRGTLIALDRAARGLLGYGKWPDAPLTLADMLPFLRRRYAAEVWDELTPDQSADLQKIVLKFGLEPFNANEVASACNKDPSWATELLTELQMSRYLLPVEPLRLIEEGGRLDVSHTVSGSALLAFGHDESWDRKNPLETSDEQALALS